VKRMQLIIAGRVRLNRNCRRKIEMTPGAQSRNDTLPAADTPRATRHHCHTLGLGDGVKGQSRRLPVRAAQPLRPSPGPSTIGSPGDRPNHRVSSVAAVAAGQVDRSEGVEVKISDGLQGVRGRRALKRVRQRFEPGSIGALQSKQLGDYIAPALRATAAINPAACADNGRRLLALVAGAKAGLTLGIAQRYFTSGFATSWHHPSPLRNAVQWK
jgi:hypothetical protein